MRTAYSPDRNTEVRVAPWVHRNMHFKEGGSGSSYSDGKGNMMYNETSLPSLYRALEKPPSFRNLVSIHNMKPVALTSDSEALP